MVGGEAAHERLERPLRSTVEGMGGKTDESRDRGRNEEDALTVFFHHGNGVLGGPEDTLHIHAHNLFPGRVIKLRDPALSPHTGVAMDTVETSVGRDRVIDHGFDAALLRDIGEDETGRLPRLAEFFLEGDASFLLIRGDDDPGAERGEMPAAGFAYARGAAGDEDDFVFQVHITSRGGRCRFQIS